MGKSKFKIERFDTLKECESALKEELRKEGLTEIDVVTMFSKSSYRIVRDAKGGRKVEVA